MGLGLIAYCNYSMNIFVFACSVVPRPRSGLGTRLFHLMLNAIKSIHVVPINTRYL